MASIIWLPHKGVDADGNDNPKMRAQSSVPGTEPIYNDLSFRSWNCLAVPELDMVRGPYLGS